MVDRDQEGNSACEVLLDYLVAIKCVSYTLITFLLLKRVTWALFLRHKTLMTRFLTMLKVKQSRKGDIHEERHTNIILLSEATFLTSLLRGTMQQAPPHVSLFFRRARYSCIQEIPLASSSLS